MALLGSALFSACGQTAAPPANASPQAASSSAAAATAIAKPAASAVTLKLASFYSLGAAPLFVGVEKGLFAKRGVDVQIERINSASDVMAILG
ncbi:MAG TPA: hypothetical protein VKU60_12520, partial [Chloroflexota bacterium]|nr:hypothetical protein [Chloroflexota bacterium]